MFRYKSGAKQGDEIQVAVGDICTQEPNVPLLGDMLLTFFNPSMIYYAASSSEDVGYNHTLRKAKLLVSLL